jgi:hypothetical protein
MSQTDCREKIEKLSGKTLNAGLWERVTKNGKSLPRDHIKYWAQALALKPGMPDYDDFIWYLNSNRAKAKADMTEWITRLEDRLLRAELDVARSKEANEEKDDLIRQMKSELARLRKERA